MDPGPLSRLAMPTLCLIGLATMTSSCIKNTTREPTASAHSPTETSTGNEPSNDTLHKPAGPSETRPPSQTQQQTTPRHAGDAISNARYQLALSIDIARRRLPIAITPELLFWPAHNGARHTHGGPPATIHEVNLVISNRDNRLHTIEFTGLELLNAHCRSEEWDRREPLAVGEVWGPRDENEMGERYDDLTVEITTSPTKKHMFSIMHPPREVYQSCDRFGYGVSMTIDGKPAKIEVPLRIVRVTPLRK